MSDPRDIEDIVWVGGGPSGKFNREFAIKKHLENSEESRIRQEEEAYQSRNAAEEAAVESRRQTELLAEQTRQAEKLAEESRYQSKLLAGDVYKKRNTPEILFTLSQQRSEIRSFCDDILNSPEDLSETTLKDSLEKITPFTRSLFALDSSYLSDFSHKQLLAEMCNEFRPLLQKCENLMDAKRYKRLMEQRAPIYRLCRELIDDSRTPLMDILGGCQSDSDSLWLSPNELERSHSAIKIYIGALCAFKPTQHYVEPVKKMRDEFRHIIDEVNAARKWQVRCAEEETQARIDERFLPLGRFTPETLNAYFTAIEHFQRLQRGGEAWEGEFQLFVGMGIASLILGFLLMIDFGLRGLFYAMLFSGLMFVGAVYFSALPKKIKAKASAGINNLNQYWPTDNAGKLKELLSMVYWKNDNWVVNKETYEEMLELEKWKITFSL